jgi:hypothetical protein
LLQPRIDRRDDRAWSVAASIPAGRDGLKIVQK